MAKTLYLECDAGISGDMTAAVLIDLGADREKLMKVLESIPADGFSVEIGRVKKAGIDCCDFCVRLDAAHENHDHDMEYLHGHAHRHGDHGACEHRHSHDAGHSHAHGEHSSHAHRGISDIKEILSACGMTERARELAGRIFDILAQAEAKAHDVPVSEVHFHEVGAIDSIVDIVAAAVCLDDLDIGEVIVPKLCEGTGTVRCQHGVLPVPVPAVANIISAYDLPLSVMDIEGEFVTPTGAAIVAAVRTSGELPAVWKIKKIGMGAGKRRYERPSILRAMLIEGGTDGEPPREESGKEREEIGQTEKKDSIYKLESNIDDSTPEALGYVMERLLEAGARDVCYTPVYMKKNRPAWQLNVICGKEDIDRLERIIFSETTTIGIRRVRMERAILARRQITVASEYGKGVVKVCEGASGRRYYPEYDSIVTICRRHGLPYREGYRILADAAARAEEDEVSKG